MEKQVQEIIEKLEMKKHPEGGFYKETYRSVGVIPQNVLKGSFSGNRNYCTAIYFLLTSENFSAFHRIKQDEIWHFYKGNSLYIHEINKKGEYIRHELGMDLSKGELPQLVIPAGSWFASGVKSMKGYSFVGCTVSPGFDFEDFEMAEREVLVREYPRYKDVIVEYTR